MSDVIATVHSRIDAVDPAQWQSLFPDHPDSLEIIRLTQQCGMEGFTFGSIVVRRGDEPILLLPIFTTRFRLADLLDGTGEKIVQAIGKVAPSLVAPRLLGVGIVEGEWGQVGISPCVDPSTLAAAWKAAEHALRQESRRAKASLIVFLNFTPEGALALPAKFARIDTIPCARLPIQFASAEEYLQRLSKNARKDLRRKMKSAAEIKVVRPEAADQWMDRIYELYLATVARAPLSLGIQRRSFFQDITPNVVGAHYVLYFHQDRLLAFNLLVERDGMLIDKYFCMEEQAGREHSLYFVSWMENVRYCCEKSLKIYHAGPGAEGTKARLGAEFIASVTFFRHRNPLVHGVLNRLKGMMAYTPAVAID